MSKIKYYATRTALWLFLIGWSIGLVGCGTVSNVINGCELPAQYEVVKNGPADLTAVDLKGHFEQEAAERHEHKQDADDFNGLHDYVKKNCQ